MSLLNNNIENVQEFYFDVVKTPSKLWQEMDNTVLEQIILYMVGVNELDEFFYNKFLVDQKKNLPSYFSQTVFFKTLLKLAPLKTLEMIREYTKEIILDASHMEAAICAGRVDVVEWLDKQGCKVDEFTCGTAARHGQYDIIRYLIKVRNPSAPLISNACENAARYGHLSILKFLYNNNCPLNEEVFAKACSGLNLEIVQWLHHMGCPINLKAFCYAACVGHWPILNFLESIHAPWNEFTCYNAMKNHHLDVLIWLRKRPNPCPINEETFDIIQSKWPTINWSNITEHQ